MNDSNSMRHGQLPKADPPDPLNVLASLFGFSAFRPHQEAVVRAVLNARDSFTVMPTGGGKSLCYQLPSRLLPGVCVVVSPLISLMKDQVDAAVATGLNAAAFNSASSAAEKSGAVVRMREGTLDLLYISPERLRLADFRALLRQQRLAFFAIDEAHCISEWGHDFRPDYLDLSSLAHDFPDVPLAAFTATATRRVEQDIIARLHLRNPLITRASFNRPNLFYQVIPKDKVERQILDFVRTRQGESGIIYRISRKDAEATAAYLSAHGFPCLAYHAGLADSDRAEAQNAFREDRCPLIAATVAFGMGIDKSNVRFVIHGDLPKSLEGYYQETGRAGRDGEPARCVLFYGRKDIAQLLRFAESVEDDSARAAAKSQVYRMLDFTQKEGCRRKALLSYFDEIPAFENCGACDICTGEAEREDATVAAQKLLSGMVRTGERFGAGHIIALVMGKGTKRMRDLGHDGLPTFGVGRDQPEAYWRRVMDALLAQGLIIVSDPAFPTPSVSSAGWELLRGKRSCAIIRLAQKAEAKSGRKTREEHPIFSLLRDERTRLAREAGVPPYVIFSDRTLREMAERLPDTPERLLGVTGVGAYKLKNYGEAFLSLVRGWLDEHPEEACRADEGACPAPPVGADKDKPAVARPAGATRASGTESWRETGRLLDQGLSLEEAAEQRGLSLSTIYRHLGLLLSNGKQYSPYRFFTPARFSQIQRLYRETGDRRLTPVVELSRAAPLSEETAVSYDEARLARLFLRGPSSEIGSGQDGA